MNRIPKSVQICGLQGAGAFLSSILHQQFGKKFGPNNFSRLSNEYGTS
jgi:hypothetical protein